MKYLKIIMEHDVDAEALQQILMHIKGIQKVELIDEEYPESHLKKAFLRGKEQLKNGEYEPLVNDLFDIFIPSKTKP